MYLSNTPLRGSSLSRGKIHDTKEWNAWEEHLKKNNNSNNVSNKVEPKRTKTKNKTEYKGESVHSFGGRGGGGLPCLLREMVYVPEPGHDHAWEQDLPDAVQYRNKCARAWKVPQVMHNGKGPE